MKPSLLALMLLLATFCFAQTVQVPVPSQTVAVPQTAEPVWLADR